MAAYGYARVSSKDQNVRRQLDALQAFPLSKRNIFIDHWTGATFDRPRYRALMRRLRAGDVLVVTSIDRLGRSYAEILDQWRYLTRTRRAAIVVLDMPLLDTRVTPSNLTGAFVADIVLQLLSYVAQIERENIRHRQAEGIAAARARGKHLGRPRLRRPPNWEEVRERIRRQELSRYQAARELGIARNTLLKWLREDGVQPPERAARGRGPGAREALSREAPAREVARAAPTPAVAQTPVAARAAPKPAQTQTQTHEQAPNHPDECSKNRNERSSGRKKPGM